LSAVRFCRTRCAPNMAEQVDQYAAFVHASADDVVDKALNYVFSRDRDFQDFLKTPQTKQVRRARMRRSSRRGRLQSGWSPRVLRGCRRHDPPFSFVPVPGRCFAPEGMWTRHPQVGNCGAPNGASMFTQVHFRCVNRLGESLDERGIER